MALRRTDVLALAILYTCRWLTTSQLAWYLGRHRNSINRTFARLRDAGYVCRYQRAVTSDAIWRVTKKTFRELREANVIPIDQLRWSPKIHEATPDFQQHTVDVNELHLRWRRAVREHPATTDFEFTAEPFRTIVSDQRGRRYSVAPDGMLVFTHSDNDLYFLIEADRASKPLHRPISSPSQSVAAQLYAYTPFYQMGRFRDLVGEQGDPIQRWPFRVLTTAPSLPRLLHMMLAVIRAMHRQRPAASASRGYGLFDDVVADPLGSCWLREVELLPFVRWLDRLPDQCVFGSHLPADTWGDVRDVVGRRILETTWRRDTRSSEIVADAFVMALRETKRLPRYSLLDAWPAAR